LTIRPSLYFKNRFAVESPLKSLCFVAINVYRFWELIDFDGVELSRIPRQLFRRREAER